MAETKLGEKKTDIWRRQRWGRGDSGGRVGEGETDEEGRQMGEGRQMEEGKQMGQGVRCWGRPSPPPQGSGEEARGLRPKLGL